MIYEPFGKVFEEKNPDVKIYNIMDDSLLVDTRTYNGMTPTIASRMLNYAKAAEASGAESDFHASGIRLCVIFMFYEGFHPASAPRRQSRECY